VEVGVDEHSPGYRGRGERQDGGAGLVAEAPVLPTAGSDAPGGGATEGTSGGDLPRALPDDVAL
jgi:hypothetical protein